MARPRHFQGNFQRHRRMGNLGYRANLRNFRGVGRARSEPVGRDKSFRMFGSSGRTRTYNPSVNSRMLYH